MQAFLGRLLIGMERYLGVQRYLVGVGDAGELGNLTPLRLQVEPFDIARDADREWAAHVHFDELADEPADFVAHHPVRGDGSGDGHHSGKSGHLNRKCLVAHVAGAQLPVAVVAPGPYRAVGL